MNNYNINCTINIRATNDTEAMEKLYQILSSAGIEYSLDSLYVEDDEYSEEHNEELCEELLRDPVFRAELESQGIL